VSIEILAYCADDSLRIQIHFKRWVDFLVNLVLEVVLQLSNLSGIKLNAGLVNNLGFADDIDLLDRNGSEVQSYYDTEWQNQSTVRPNEECWEN